jgi:YesN/AraC family two-component response regulator
MTRLGYASDGDSALQAVVHDRSDLVFVDVNMPGIDGF